MLLGAAVFAGAFAYTGFDFSKFSTDEFTEKTYTVDGAFTGVSIDAGEADVDFAISGNGKVTAECFESDKISREVFIKDGILCIRQIDGHTWIDRIGITAQSPKMTVYLPVAEYESIELQSATGDITLPGSFSFGKINITTSTGDAMLCAGEAQKRASHGAVEITSSTGDIVMNGFEAADIQIKTSTGDITVNDVSCAGEYYQFIYTGDTAITALTCKSFEANTSTGMMNLNGVLVSGPLEITSESGDISLALSDADEISINTSTGEVTGSLLSEKVFNAQSSTGDISVPGTNAGGKCDITTSTGDINIVLSEHR